MVRKPIKDHKAWRRRIPYDKEWTNNYYIEDIMSHLLLTIKCYWIVLHQNKSYHISNGCKILHCVMNISNCLVLRPWQYALIYWFGTLQYFYFSPTSNSFLSMFWIIVYNLNVLRVIAGNEFLVFLSERRGTLRGSKIVVQGKEHLFKNRLAFIMIIIQVYWRTPYSISFY